MIWEVKILLKQGIISASFMFLLLSKFFMLKAAMKSDRVLASVRVVPISLLAVPIAYEYSHNNAAIMSR